MNFQLLKQIVSNIILTIEQSAVVSVRSLKAHTFGVKVTNYPKVQRIEGEVVVNQSKVVGALEQSNTKLSSLIAIIKAWRFPKEIRVTNFPAFPKPTPFPTSFDVNNFPKVPDYPKEIRISNLTELDSKNVVIELGLIKKAIRDQKLDPKITVTPAPTERIVVPAPSVTVTQQEIDYEKLSTAVSSKIPEINYTKLAEAIAKELAQSMVSMGSGGGGGGRVFSSASGSVEKALIDSERRQVVVSSDEDLTRRFQISEKDAAGETKYYGFIDENGAWYIMKDTGTTYRYVRGDADYAAAWTGRAGLSYDYYSEVF